MFILLLLLSIRFLCFFQGLYLQLKQPLCKYSEENVLFLWVTVGKVHAVDDILAIDRYLLAWERRREVKIAYTFAAKTCFERGIFLVRCNINKDLIRWLLFKCQKCETNPFVSLKAVLISCIMNCLFSFCVFLQN